MRSTNLSVGLTAIVIVAITMLGARAVAQQEVVLHNFGTNGSDGSGPFGGLIFDSAGNLYGTTSGGGAYGGGTVFELIPRAGKGWAEKTLHDFNNNGQDGYSPYTEKLTFDAAGNLYGTTYLGGVYNYGTVFQLTPAPGGGWTEKILHSFNNDGKDGAGPYLVTLVFDAAGNLYGATAFGGAYGAPNVYGTAFELSPKAGGGWTERILHSFNFNGQDGYYPNGGLVPDVAGNLYGTTSEGGIYSFYGTVFELRPTAGGGWAEEVLHDFNNDGKDGWAPIPGLLLDVAGNLYGTTGHGGSPQNGTVFQLAPVAGGKWRETILYSFDDKNGSDPSGGVISDAAGNLYGTTFRGGSFGTGVAFKLTPTIGDAWTETPLHTFGHTTDGQNPIGTLILDPAGNLYGTTDNGGTFGLGAVFEIKP